MLLSHSRFLLAIGWVKNGAGVTFGEGSWFPVFPRLYYMGDNNIMGKERGLSNLGTKD